MQIAIQSMFWMAIIDVTTSSFILFTVSNYARENGSCRRRLRERSRVLERTYAWIPAATEMNNTIQDEA